MPQPIIITDTDAVLSKTFGPFDTRGIGSIGLFTTVPDSLAVGTDALNVVVFTRKAGKPWMNTPALEMSVGMPLLSLGTRWPLLGTSAGGLVIPTEWIDGFHDLLDESVVVAQPALAAGGTPASGDTTGSSVTFSVAGGLNGDFGNAFSVDLVDPGVPDSPLSISSVDGFVMTISLETDSMGALVSLGSDMEALLGGAPGSAAPGWAITAAANSNDPLIVETIPLTGGNGGATGVTYEVTGSY